MDQKTIAWLRSSFGIWIKKRFECFLDFATSIPLMNIKKQADLKKTARLKEVFKSVSLHFRINHIIVFFLGLLGVVFIRHGFA